MIFSPDLAAKVMDGTKTVTRRRLHGRPIRDQVGRTYAVQPGRGQKAIGRIRITAVRTERLGDITMAEAHREGFPETGNSIWAFIYYWERLHGGWDPDEEVAVIEFEVVR